MTQTAVSFRDPGGICCVTDRGVFRLLAPECLRDWEAFQQTAAARAFIERRQMVGTRRLPENEIGALRQDSRLSTLLAARQPAAVLEHERIPFPSYPFEWPPEMLHEAGRLTLELAVAALEEGWGLKDATPYNVLFRGSEAVFIDVLSFEPRLAGDPVWKPYGQFVRTFLLPLLANRHWGLRLADIFTTHRDGLEPEEVYRFCGPFQRLKPRILSLVSLPAWLRRKAEAEGDALYQTHALANAEKAKFIVNSILKQLRRTLESLRPPAAAVSVWSDYMSSHSYDQPGFAAKQQFVDSLLEKFHPARVLDAGANTGHFSARAAAAGAEVVAIDLDPACVGAIWRRAQAERLNILPLVVDISRPSPAVGWRNQECASFLDRAAGTFDAVLMLALVHHLLVTERVPLDEIFEMAAGLTRSLLVIEYIPPEDEMFRKLTRGREALFGTLTQEVFERACSKRFEIIQTLALPGTQRRMYGLQRKGGNP
jgi:2-polyprenyl-3-methyl-5-hydroxy-6-metoxy-1,4-benzoquinol methylase